jgi:branched-chain amino acid transport system ATP-binding protein
MLLAARSLYAGYHGHSIVHDLNLEVHSGEVVALLGPNGAGKTTTLMTLAGELPRLAGEVLVDGVASNAPLHHRSRRGLGLVTEERAVFMPLTVLENLKAARCDIEYALTLFPELRPLLKRQAGLLSGGEQQMLALGRALARRPRVLLADELSLGLAPLVVARLLQAVRDAADADGIGVILVEQHIRHALAIADRLYLMRRGEIVLEGRTADFTGRINEIEAAYLSR